MRMVTIVILNWNGKQWLSQFLPSVLQTHFDAFEILLVDNASTDDSVAFVQNTFPTIRVLQLDKNYGFAEGNNRALPHVHTPYYVLLNSDVEVDKNWLQPLVDRMESNPQLAAIQPKVLAYHARNKFEHAGAAGGWMDTYLYPFCKGRIFDETETDNGQYEDFSEVFWATGACCIVRKSVTDAIGLFEPTFFAHMEEIDFCWRAQNFGWRIGYEPKSVIWHVGGGTLPKQNPRKLFLNIRNSLSMMFRNLPASHIFPKIFMRLVLDGVFAVKLLTQGEFQQIFTILKAHFAFYGAIPYLYQTRKKLYSNQKIAFPSIGVWNKSVVWAHFIKGKKTFGVLDIPPNK